ncbi:hypothetical protein ADIWIN_2328 [Winogradskyella psychrotolerans RS-3]|uniref:Uncharacterized protein n=1 Tax=Winogradskyella psychrotolerans RS-3 TaxID=641526 RepID=S7VR92_9FLAO|nr:hypothetical protein ADIWIN_2328 [Winogradskyella psychrotolerans RS-3]
MVLTKSGSKDVSQTNLIATPKVYTSNIEDYLRLPYAFQFIF